MLKITGISFNKKLFIKGFLLVTIFISFIQKSYSIEYIDAYRVCSPVSHEKTKHDCEWDRIYEHYYQHCMSKPGFANQKINLENQYYNEYMKFHKNCSSTADYNSKEYCNYGDLYNKHYNNCMLSQGFEKNGEKINNSAGHKERKFNFNF